MMVHTMNKTEVLKIVHGVESEPCEVSVPRWIMTEFLQQHIDILDRPAVTHHLGIVENALPHVRFCILEDDEWEQQKAKFLSGGLIPVDVVNYSGGSTPHFVIEHDGERKRFEVAYTVFHETPTGTDGTFVGSAMMSLLLTGTYVTPGVLTYAHIKLAKGDA